MHRKKASGGAFWTSAMGLVNGWMSYPVTLQVLAALCLVGARVLHITLRVLHCPN